MSTILEKNIGQIVADDYRTARVFKTYGIDFCCKGNRSLSEASGSQRIPVEQLAAELEDVINAPVQRSDDYQSWPIDLLANYIERIHHQYVRDQSEDLTEFLQKLCKVHGRQHPELISIQKLFLESVGDLADHMQKEEMILFPRIREMVNLQLKKKPLTPPKFGTVQNPIRMMMHEHDNEGERFRQIARLSNNYTPPGDACNTYKVTYALLREFEENLHLHVHLENNILFPKAIALEEELNQAKQ